jgi:hypothetical protein
MTFSIGPPGPGPNDPPVCVYGVVGAYRSAKRLTLTSSLTAILWATVVALTGTFVALSVDSAWGKLAGAVIGVAVATVLTYTAIAVWILSPLGRHYH